jgi:tripartite-type tricarboxylate transporter receptor subunit TctC
MTNRIVLIGVVAWAGLLGCLDGARAQAAYPDHPIRILVGYPAGGGVDAMARMLAPRLQAELGQTIIVENRTGASGAIAGDVVARAAPDGYTLFLGESATLIAPYLRIKLPFDPVKSFAPVAGVFRLPLVIIANNDFKVKTTRDLIVALKAEPDHYSYGSPGIGTVQQLAFESFKVRTGTSAVHIPYRGAAQIIPGVMSGQIALGIVTAGSVMQQVKAGGVHAIAMMSGDKLAGAEGIPSLDDTLPGFDAAPRIFLLAPARTPPAVIDRLVAATQKAMSGADLVSSAALQGAVPAFLPPAVLASKLAEESKAWGALIQSQKITVE